MVIACKQVNDYLAEFSHWLDDGGEDNDVPDEDQPGQCSLSQGRSCVFCWKVASGEKTGHLDLLSLESEIFTQKLKQTVKNHQT